jgi:hypothetical protein
MSHAFSARRRQCSTAALHALDFGLRVRVETCREQRSIFSGSENLSARELTSELAEAVSRLRVRSFLLRADLEHMTSALQVNVECGFWTLARRAAFDLAGTLTLARRRGFADPEICHRAANCALRIGELCEKEAR